MRRVARGLVRGGRRLNPEVWVVGGGEETQTLKWTEYITGVNKEWRYRYRNLIVSPSEAMKLSTELHSL